VTVRLLKTMADYYYGGERETFIYTNAKGIKNIRDAKKTFDVRLKTKFIDANIEEGKIIKYKNMEDKEADDTVLCKITSKKEFASLEAVLDDLEIKDNHGKLGAGAERDEIIKTLSPFFAGKLGDGVKLVLFGFSVDKGASGGASGGKPRRRAKSKSKTKSRSRSRSKPKNKK
jgi:hypothetical protein